MLLGILIVFILVAISLVVSNNEKGGPKQEINVYNKYGILMRYFMSRQNARINRQDQNFVEFEANDDYSIDKYDVIQNGKEVSIFWSHSSDVLGRHSLSWKFPQDMSQYAMVDEIVMDLKTYEQILRDSLQ
jgi:hypothetical protein